VAHEAEGEAAPPGKDFEFEDWAFLTLRYELYLLAHMYAKVLDDPERPGIHESHLPFYYGKFFKKQLAPKLYGKDTFAELSVLLKETASIDERGVLVLAASEEKPLDDLLKQQEECRQERQKRLESGDESWKLDLTLLLQQKALLEKQALMQKQAQAMAAAGVAGGAMVPPPGAPQWQAVGGGGMRPQWQQAPRQPQWQAKGGGKWGKM